MYDYQQRMSRPTGPDYVDTSGAQDFFEDGWLMFSGLMIFFVGFWNAFEGGLAFLRSAYFAGTPVFGSLPFWAVVWIAIGVFEIGLAMLIMRGNNLARWAGVAVVVDPPYAMFADLQPQLARYLPSILAPDGLVVVETDTRVELELPPLAVRTSRRYGAARLSLFERAP